MRIINLIEDTEGRCGCAYAHGLSFYIETGKHKLLWDLGPSEAALQNAAVLGIDLTAIDTVILSHGHYDHAGGILPFSGLDDKALLYMQESAAGEYYADDGKEAAERFRYIGIDKRIIELPQIRLLKGDTRIDDELELFVIRRRSHPLPSMNRRLLVRMGDVYRQDDFCHEHFLVIHQCGRSILLSGCAHNGILSILDEYRDRYGKAPDLVVSGFHLMKKTAYLERDREEIEEIARALKEYPTRFVTCHCTGATAYNVMKEILGDRLEYVHSGEEINLS